MGCGCPSQQDSHELMSVAGLHRSQCKDTVVMSDFSPACGCGAGNDEKSALSPKMREQAAAVAAELSARTPAEGVAKTAPLTRPQEPEEALPPVSESAVHPKLRQKAVGSSR